MSRSVLSGGRRRRRRWPGWLARAAALVALAVLAVVLTRGGEEPGPPAGARAGAGAGRPPAAARAWAGRPRPRRWRRRRRRRGAAQAPAGWTSPGDRGGRRRRGGRRPRRAPAAAPEPAERRPVRSPLAVRLAEKPDRIRLRFRDPPRSGLLFDLDSGAVLWRRAPRRILPIASLTKLMTALLAAERLPRGKRVLVTAQALRYRGSGVGLLPRGKRIRVDTMLHGLLLPSGNDAAIALAQAAADGSRRRFVRLMNRRARSMGLACTRFSGPDGYEDRGNHSCAADLAVMARAVLRVRRLARIVRRRSAVLPFPIRGGRLYLYNNNPLLRVGYPGTTGLKTGYTDAAGRCLVATATRRAAAARRRPAALPGPRRPGPAAARPGLGRQPLTSRRPYPVWMSMARPHPDPTPAGARKAEHLRIAGEAGVDHARSTGLEHVRLRHRALPGGALAAVALETTLLGARLGAPLVISAMTGGTSEAAAINRRLAAAAADHGVALALGSGRPLLDDPDAAPHLPAAGRRPAAAAAGQPRGRARCAGRGPRTARSASSTCSAPTGSRSTSTPCRRRSSPRGRPTSPACSRGSRRWPSASRPRPVVAKEVGFGLDPEDVRLLAGAGVAAVDVAGAGGTNWALIEGRRDTRAGAVAAAFAELGHRDRRRAARRAWPPPRACPSSPRAACGTASTSPSAWPWARPPRGSPARSCSPPRPTGPARRSARCSTSCASRPGPPARPRRPRSGRSTCDEGGGRRRRASAGSPPRCASRAMGWEVTVLEQRDATGRPRRTSSSDAGFTWDTGPSLITMPWVLEETFAAGGLDLHAEVALRRLDPMYRIRWAGEEEHFDFTDDPGAAARGDGQVLARRRRAGRAVPRRPAPHLRGGDPGRRAGARSSPCASSPGSSPSMVRLGALRPLHAFVARHFEHPRVREAFSFHSLFIGGDPYRVPAIYAALVYLQVLDGGWYADGGVVQRGGGDGPAAGRALRRAGRGASSTAGGRVTGVRLAGGERIPADVVVSNADVLRTHELVGRTPPRRRLRETMSCFLLYLGTRPAVRAPAAPHAARRRRLPRVHPRRHPRRRAAADLLHLRARPVAHGAGHGGARRRLARGPAAGAQPARGDRLGPRGRPAARRADRPTSRRRFGLRGCGAVGRSSTA